MLLDIRHVTRYHYEHPVRESVMELRMQPQKSVRQRLISFDLDLEPRAQLFSYIDPFGNAVHHFDVPQPHDELTIVARATVETQEPPELPAGLDLGEWDRLNSSFTQAECFDFLQPHGFAVKTDALTQFMAAKGLDRPRLRDPLTGLRQLNETIYSAFDYEPGVTRADSPIDHALESGAGVCQDFAHIMIAICRDWGLPARYVSGYLFTDRKKGDRSDPDATHAWVEVFLPSHRWVGFDPTNNILTGERHVAVAMGRDYSDVPPSRGVYKGDSDSQLAVDVAVSKAKSALAEPEFFNLPRPTFRGGRRRGVDAFREEQQQQQQQ
ncbi:transglutaminase family protein [Caulobacter sp. SLTY]|uniref:transglutaminase family protein n=1 Tax=Caulobacter sp. SLTY TaxID=2683262 RepID=UPI0014122B7C|nr:transglutaminase family protein [Caulobacter sp. SLTY]NBB15506.1 transglutaminase family protein [Caulobacter sp. SLTY]